MKINSIATIFVFLLIIVPLKVLSFTEISKPNNPLSKIIQTKAFYGDLHIHSTNSSDAFIFNVIATPDDAYLYAKGKPIKHILGYPIQLKSGPLDFAAVTDHAELLGVFNAMADKKHRMSKLSQAIDLQSSDRKKVVAAFVNSMKDATTRGNQSPVWDHDVIRSAWQETIEAAERHNQPGTFTTFIGYEYSSAPKNQNLHRNVIFASNKVPKMPFSSIDSENPEDLWRWLDHQRKLGIPALAIPHNSNVSNGLMFEKTNWNGESITKEYAQLRLRNEPLVEITQVKGTSETHPSLSRNDEWADFELYDNLIASEIVAKKPGGFVREAYLNGLIMQHQINANPYKFGVIGASDSHNSAPSVEEDNYFGKVGFLDGTGVLRGSVTPDKNRKFGRSNAAQTFTQWSASGLTGIWAEQNTRESLFSAMQRKETFATSGPRIRVRFFAGYDFSKEQLNNPKLASIGYQKGVAMGADFKLTNNESPSFIVWAVKDPNSYNLQRLQIIKGWTDETGAHEQVIDVACGNGELPDENFRCKNILPSLDLKDCSVSSKQGKKELKTLWKDPAFNPEQLAFYYVRVLEEASCRWSTWDAIRAGATPQANVAKSLQERAWSSPIWLIPK